MSHVVDHVDEAQLHAYLDQELEFSDPEVRKAVGAHIADCSQCSNLLKEVRRVYKTAHRILDVATPAPRSRPSFEEIVTRAAELQDNGVQESRFRRADDAIEDPVESDLLVQLENASDDTPDLVVDDPDRDVADESFNVEAVTEEPPELEIPSEDEIVFIEPTPVGDEWPQPSVAADRPSPAQAPPQRKPARRRGTRVLALAATIIVAVGIGGWFGRPYVLQRFSNGTVAAPPAETPAPVAAAPRQELRESVAFRPPADARVGASAGALSPTTSQDVAPSEDAAGAASAMPGRTIVGTVRDAASKRAIAGAEVILVGTNQIARTDSAGRYEIANVPAGSVSVDVMGLGYERSAKGLTVSEKEGAIADFELRTAAKAVDEMTVADAIQPARERALNAPAAPSSETSWSPVTRENAEALLGGPLVAIDGSAIESIQRAAGRDEILVTQTTRTGSPIYLRILSSGRIGASATLESVEVTSPTAQRPSTGVAKYGNYVIIVEANVTSAELESLLRRITVAPEVN